MQKQNVEWKIQRAEQNVCCCCCCNLFFVVRQFGEVIIIPLLFVECKSALSLFAYSSTGENYDAERELESRYLWFNTINDVAQLNFIPNSFLALKHHNSPLSTVWNIWFECTVRSAPCKALIKATGTQLYDSEWSFDGVLISLVMSYCFAEQIAIGYTLSLDSLIQWQWMST